VSSVKDPDPKLLAGSGKTIPDPDPGCSGSKLNLKYNYFDKLIKFNNFSSKCSISKIKNFLFFEEKKAHKKLNVSL